MTLIASRPALAVIATAVWWVGGRAGAEGLPAAPQVEAEVVAAGIYVPESGALSLDQLIALALANSPELAKLRGETGVAKAQVLAAKDLEDPEIRLSYQRDHDVEDPRDQIERFNRTTTETFETRGGEVSQRNSSALVEDPLVDDQIIQIGTSEAERSGFQEAGSRTRNERGTRRIERGNRSDRIVTDSVETITERGQTSEFGFGQDRFRTSTATVPFSERSSENSTTRRRSRTVEERFYNYDRSAPDSDFDISLRFFVPNPWERKARINRARANVGLTTALADALEHQIAVDVREAYAELKAADAELTSSESLISVWQSIVAEQEDAAPVADIEDIIRAENNLLDAEIDADTRRFRFDRAVAELATLFGLADPGRISLDSSLAPRALAPAGLERSFLHLIAETYRGELVALRHQSTLSKFDLKEYNAKKIPWVAFVEGFYGVEYTGSDRVADNYGVQVAISLPLFSWFKNKENEVYEESIRSFNRQAAVVRNRIQNEVDSALAAFLKADQRIQSHESSFRVREQALRARLAESEDLGLRGREAAIRAKEQLARIQRTRRSVYSYYNEALIALERAIGTDIKNVFSTKNPAGAISPVQGSPR
ncbi:hypothetical protein BH23VER1_BH23VER1_18690 [soil metagenome]